MDERRIIEEAVHIWIFSAGLVIGVVITAIWAFLIFQAL